MVGPLRCHGVVVFVVVFIVVFVVVRGQHGVDHEEWLRSDM
jgi:hypothetical protein